MSIKVCDLCRSSKNLAEPQLVAQECEIKMSYTTNCVKNM